jgi:selenocysteine lyase/cysteine desulfurase
MIYLDNAATSYPKPRSVIEKLNSCLREACGNPGRSGHTLSVMASEEIYSAREAVSELLEHSHPESVVFTYNATHAINLALKSYITEPCHVICSDIEHNSVIRPLEAMRRSIGIRYSVYSTDGDVYRSIKDLIQGDTSCMISTLASNVTGREIDPAILSRIASENKLLLILDASQAIGHRKISLSDTPCDVLVAPSHKALFGIQGSGFAVFKDTARHASFIEGGSGSESKSTEMPSLLPEGYEAGTPSTPAIATLTEGIRFVNEIGIDKIRSILNKLTEETCDALSEIEGVTVYAANNGIVTFNLKNYSPSYVARELDKMSICVREGLHCAPSAHKKLGTEDRGAIRVSFSCMNTEDDIHALIKAVRSIKE